MQPTGLERPAQPNGAPRTPNDEHRSTGFIVVSHSTVSRGTFLRICHAQRWADTAPRMPHGEHLHVVDLRNVVDVISSRRPIRGAWLMMSNEAVSSSRNKSGAAGRLPRSVVVRRSWHQRHESSDREDFRLNHHVVEPWFPRPALRADCED